MIDCSERISIFVIHLSTMVSLILAILFSTLIIVCFRVLGKLKFNELQSITFNYFFAVLYGLLIWNEPFDLVNYTERSWFGFSLLIGVFFIVTFFLLSRSSQAAGVSITAVASRMSVIIPVAAGFVIYHDHVNLLKLIAIGLALFSFYLIFKPKTKRKINSRRIILPALLFIGIGINDSMMKYIQYNYLKADLTLFLTIIFLVAFIIGFMIMLYNLLMKKSALSFRNIFYGFILGSLNFGSTYFFIRSMSEFESSVLFPVVNVSIVVLSSLVGLLVFKEKLSKTNWIGILTAITSILIITIV